MNEAANDSSPGARPEAGLKSVTKLLVLVAGLVGAGANFGIYKLTHPISTPDPEIARLAEPRGVGQSPPIEDMVKVDLEMSRVEKLNATIVFTYSAGVICLALLLAVGPQGVPIAIWGAAAGVGLLASLGLGFLGGLTGESLLSHWRASEGVVSVPHLLQAYVAAGALVGTGPGIALAATSAHGSQRSKVLLGAVFGGASAGVLFVLLTAVVLTNAQTDRMINPADSMQALWLGLVSVGIAAGYVLFSSMELGPKKVAAN